MSSSEAQPTPRRFLAGLIAGLAGTLALLAGAMLVVDPLGATDGNALCRAGAKNIYSSDFKALIASRMRPRTVVLGTSRLKLGFGEEALALLGPSPAVNLGVDAALPADFDSLSGEALAGGRLERAFIGIDFNTVHQWGAVPLMDPIAKARFPWLERWRRAFLGYEAFRALPSALRGCRPAFHGDGAPVLNASGGIAAEHGNYLESRSDIARGLRANERPGAETTTARLGQLQTLVADLRKRGVTVVVFSAPYQEGLLTVYDELGMRGRFERFHADVAQLARKERVAFVDLHSPAGVAALALPACPGGGIACHYLDLTHYSPLVGERIAAQLAASAGP